jgi:hypothetical protein
MSAAQGCRCGAGGRAIFLERGHTFLSKNRGLSHAASFDSGRGANVEKACALMKLTV